MARGQSLYDWCQENGEWKQQLIAEQVGKDESGENIDITNISSGSHKRVW